MKDLNPRSGWVIRDDLLGVEYVRELVRDDPCAVSTGANRVTYHRPDRRALVPGTEIYDSEVDALDTLVRLLPLHVGLLEREVARFLDQAARTRAAITVAEAKRDEAEARRDQLLKKGWG